MGNNLVEITPGAVITFLYTNYKGQKYLRQAVVLSWQYGMTEYHNNHPMLLLEGFDVQKQAVRLYAVEDIHDIRVVQVDAIDIARRAINERARQYEDVIDRNGKITIEYIEDPIIWGSSVQSMGFKTANLEYALKFQNKVLEEGGMIINGVPHWAVCAIQHVNEQPGEHFIVKYRTNKLTNIVKEEPFLKSDINGIIAFQRQVEMFQGEIVSGAFLPESSYDRAENVRKYNEQLIKVFCHDEDCMEWRKLNNVDGKWICSGCGTEIHPDRDLYEPDINVIDILRTFMDKKEEVK